MMLKVAGNHFIDQNGRLVILHGVNMVCKDKSRGYIGDWDKEDFSKLQKWGMNVIRFGVNWDGIEPKPGEYNDSYIEKLRHLIQLANKYNVMVILDMHQDLYSSEYGNGAPAWATISDGEVYESGVVWSDAYLFNSAVQKAFDNFWNNTPGPDGIGLQDHYAKAWGYLVEKLHYEPNIIGYDLMNEPFIGSAVQQVNKTLFGKYVEIYSERFKEINIDELFSAWSEPQNKHDYLSLLDNMDVFKSIIDSPSHILQPFEEEVLTTFYEKIAKKIRRIDKTRILFLEANYFSNLGAKSMIQPLKNELGEQDENQAYAPHTYDFVTDTDLSHTANDQRLEFIYSRHEETRQRLNMPMLVGEWGAFYESNHTGHLSIFIQHLIEKLLCSNTYWDYTPNMDKSLSFLGVRRGYPMAVAGELLNYRYEHSVKTFQMKWVETKTTDKPTIIYLPDIRDVHVTLSPINSTYRVQEIEGSHAGIIEIPSVSNSNRSIVIIAK